jgi:hypothetical protein
MDVQHTPLYDTVSWSAGDSVTELTGQWFTNVGPSSSKTKAKTNMTQSRRLPAPEAFSVFGIRVYWKPNVLLADLISVLDNFALEFYLGQKSYNLGPLWYYAAGAGIDGVAATTATSTTITSWLNGAPHRESMHKLALPIVIENQMTFWAQLVGTSTTLTASGSGGTGLTLTVLLDGFYARGVQ